DSKWIAYVSDRSGEDELYIAPQDGLGKEQQITSGHKGFMFQPEWSYDSKKLAWTDQTLRLWYVDTTDKKPVEVNRAKYGEITNYSWSPDSKWLSYDKPAENLYAFVNLYSLADRKVTPVTNSMYNSFAPIFDPDGKYLYFLSDRDFNEVLGNVDFEFANPKTTRVYIVTLKKDEASPFNPQSDEAGKKEEKKEKKDETSGASEESKGQESKESKSKNKEAGKESKEKEKPSEFRIDLDGIQDRIVAVPGEPAVIRSFSAAKGFIYYASAP